MGAIIGGIVGTLLAVLIIFITIVVIIKITKRRILVKSTILPGMYVLLIQLNSDYNHAKRHMGNTDAKILDRLILVLQLLLLNTAPESIQYYHNPFAF